MDNKHEDIAMTFENEKFTFNANNNEYSVQISMAHMTDESYEDVKFYDLKLTQDNDTVTIFGDFTMLSEYIIDFNLSDCLQ